MTRKIIQNKIQDIFREIFDDQNLIVDENTNPENIKEWDSLAHVNILVAIEKEFDVKFEISEIENTKNVEEILKLVIKKIK